MILFCEKTDFLLRNKMVIKNWIVNACKKETKVAGDISFIFCNSEEFLKINIKYLNHDFLTDVITFDYSVDNKINGDIFINMDCVNINSNKFKNTLEKELYRVMIHGVLHLLNYKDKTKNEKKLMRKKEDFHLCFLLKTLSVN